MSGVPHHCHHKSLVWRHTCFAQFAKTELYPWSQHICAWFGLVIALLMVFQKNAIMCIKKVKLINHYCLPILMLLYIMLHIMLACLMLVAALSNAVCLYNASFFFHFFAISFWECSLFSCFVLICWHSLVISSMNSIMRSAFNLLFFHKSMSTYERAMCSLEKSHLKIAFFFIIMQNSVPDRRSITSMSDYKVMY